MEKFDENDIHYQQAKKQVEQLTGFYGHLFVYVAVNIIIAFYNISHLEPGESYFQFKNFFTAIFWGIGLLVHALSVFLPKIGAVKKWEEDKIREIIDKKKDH